MKNKEIEKNYHSIEEAKKEIERLDKELTKTSKKINALLIIVLSNFAFNGIMTAISIATKNPLPRYISVPVLDTNLFFAPYMLFNSFKESKLLKERNDANKYITEHSEPFPEFKSL